MSGIWSLSFTARAQKDLRKADKVIRQRVIDALDRLVAGDPSVDIRKLASRKDQWRLRVGNWRVIYSQDSNARLYVVIRVLPRDKDTYS